MRILHFLLGSFVLSSSDAGVAKAAPGWAVVEDGADNNGYVFVCEGTGATEDDAIAAAQASCNDKICQICGVETDAGATGKRGGLGRKVTERCKRVRKQLVRPKYKSTDCGPEGCAAWLQTFYAKDEARLECPRYANDEFVTIEVCEKDLEDFRSDSGRRSVDLRRRLFWLDAAIKDCAQIDGRPTPAALALTDKLIAGLDSVATPTTQNESWHFYRAANAFLKPYPSLKQDIATSKHMLDRIRLVRDYLQNRVLVMDVVELFDATEWDTKAGMERVVAAMRRASPGAQYDTPKIHYYYLYSLERAKSDTSAMGAFLRTTYPASKLDMTDATLTSIFFRGNGEVNADEWLYVLNQSRARPCVHCLRMLIEVPRHQPEGLRVPRLLEALGVTATGDAKRVRRIFGNMVPYNDASFVLDIEKKLPAKYQDFYGFELYDELLSRVRFPPRQKEGEVLARRIADLVLRSPVNGKDDLCRQLVDRLPVFSRYGLKMEQLDARVCECLDGPLAKVLIGDYHKAALYSRALERDLPCVR